MRKALCVLLFGLGSASTAHAQANEATNSPDRTITVKAERPTVARTVNSTTYDVRNNAQAQAGTAADVLNTIPSVSVTENGAVSVRGNGQVQLYINGKPASAAGSATTLLAMPGSAVASVEVMTNPSAAYDSNGAAIVNLILKKDADAGPHATLTANAGDHRRGNVSIIGSYGGKRLSANATFSLRDDVRFTRILNDRILKSDGVETGRSTRRADYTPTHAKALNADGSLVYKLGASSDLGANFSLSHSSPKNRVFEHRVDYDPAGDVVSNYERIRGGSYFGHSGDVSVYYEDRGSADRGSLKIVAQAQRDSIRSDRPFLLVPSVPTGPDSAQRFYNGTFTQTQRLTADYAYPLRKGVRVSLGAEIKRDTLRFDNGQAAVAPDALDGQGPPPIATVYRVTNITAALYATIEAQWRKWTVQAGARGQLAKIDFDGTSAMRPAGRTLRALNQSLSIARDVGSDKLMLKMSRTQQLFDLRDLDPLVATVDPNTSSTGNPRLRPQAIASVEGSYSFGKGDRSGAVTLYYRHAHDTLADYNIFLADNVEVSAKRNFGNAQSFGVEASVSNALSKTLKYSLTANGFRSLFPEIEDDGSGRTRSKYSYTLRASLDWTPGAADSLRLDANAQGPTLVPQGEKSGTYAVAMVWRHILSAKLTASLSGQSLLRRTYIRTVIDTPTGYDVGRRLNGGRAAFAGIKYKIG